ncbi:MULTISPECIES: hypothetical protein [Tatumella]|uniref:Uncharacterized protein n=2 Tax=Tatumella ptyseos TaxID=82987 RepID=A0A085JE76_9GAMM|nr:MULTISPECIES: hypothetical protein [Tatumella]KFD18772.1 hypothetical protein GTPT_2070 [Tatumella ptyseos ATCC 33301]SQK75163.1 Uncharacterised protein [Tatumella ptyseos]
MTRPLIFALSMIRKIMSEASDSEMPPGASLRLSRIAGKATYAGEAESTLRGKAGDYQ